MIRILVNDGIDASGKKMMEDAGFFVSTDKITQDDLMTKLNAFDAICVRSATTVRKELIDACPNLKVIARGGVGLDNIDVEYAKSKGIIVINTPAASSRSVAELVFAHLLSLSRFLHDANRNMPKSGSTDFGKLKSSYAKGGELEGKTLGVIGMGRIGQEAMRIGIGMGMNVIAHDPFMDVVVLNVGSQQFPHTANIKSSTKEEVLSSSDFITLHIPSLAKPAIGSEEFAMMKDGVIIANAARGGVIDETALLEALNSGKVGGAGLDVFENEPTPRAELLVHPKISLTPHIGASTEEAQLKVGTDLAKQVIAALS